jgi:hypothetical protein
MNKASGHALGANGVMEFEQLLKPEDVAAILGLSLAHLESWRITDVGPPYIKMSSSRAGHVRYRRSEILAWQRRVKRVVPVDWPGAQLLTDANPEEPFEWLTPKPTAIALGIAIPTLTAWKKRCFGIPFIWIGGGGIREVMYDRRDVEFLAARVRTDPSLMPVVPKPPSPTAGLTPEQRKARSAQNKKERDRLHAMVWKEMGNTDEEIARRLK